MKETDELLSKGRRPPLLTRTRVEKGNPNVRKNDEDRRYRVSLLTRFSGKEGLCTTIKISAVVCFFDAIERRPRFSNSSDAISSSSFKILSQLGVQPISKGEIWRFTWRTTTRTANDFKV